MNRNVTLKTKLTAIYNYLLDPKFTKITLIYNDLLSLPVHTASNYLQDLEIFRPR